MVVNLLKRALIVVAILLIILSSAVSAAVTAQGVIDLTDKEKAYIQSKGSIKLVVDPDWYPYEKIDKTDEYIGIASDLIALISKRTGLKIEIIPTVEWKESLEKAKSGDADVVGFLNKTDERSQWLLFTEPYFIDPNVFITRENHDYISDLSRFINETMVLPEGTSIEERLRKAYPNLKIVIVKSEEEAIEYVEENKADFTLRSLTMAAYVIKNEGHFNLKIAGEVPAYKNQFSMGVTKQDEILRDILNKGISTISEQDVQDAINNYIAIKVVKGFDYKLFFIIFSVFSIVLLSALYWLRRVQSLNKRLEDSEKEYRIIAEELESKNKLLETNVATDILTGLRNRQFFNQRVHEELERFKRYETKLSLLMIDIDHFKRINDTYGHAIGDEVLKKVSSELQNQLRKVDLVARWGGEEFIALLPETEIVEAVSVAEKLREKIEMLIHENNEVVTISIGISMLEESESIDSWINRADKALYHAKKQGRNRYCVSAEVSEVDLIDIIKWDPDWNSGCTSIDQQHTKLLTMCNELMNKVIHGDNNYTVFPDLEKLISHVKEHFEHEEDVLCQYGYSEVIDHKKHHDELITKVQNLVQKSEEGYLLPIDVMHFVLDDVIVKHLLKEDTKYFDLFKVNS